MPRVVRILATRDHVERWFSNHIIAEQDPFPGDCLKAENDFKNLRKKYKL